MLATGATLSTSRGPVTVDVAYGGAFYGSADVGALGLSEASVAASFDAAWDVLETLAPLRQSTRLPGPLRDLLGVSIIPPYKTYVPYQEYVLPGLIGIVILYQCMQSALSMVYDREAGVMRVMLVTPLPRNFTVLPPSRGQKNRCSSSRLA